MNEKHLNQLPSDRIGQRLAAMEAEARPIPGDLVEEARELWRDRRGPRVRVRYGEVLAAYLRGDSFEAEVYGTQMLNDCPQALWETLDPVTIAQEMGAMVVKLNGPRYWMLDGLGQKVAVVDPALRDFNGIGVDLTLTEANLGGLGQRLAMPEGWSFRTRILDDELVVDTTATIATVLQDELENTYTLPI